MNKTSKNVVEGKLPEYYYPVFFGTDKFEGLQYILKQSKANNCPKWEVENFRGRVKSEAQFI